MRRIQSGYSFSLFLCIAAITSLLSLFLAGCQLGGPRATDGGFDSENPGAILYAIHQAGETKDESAVLPLIELLDHDDPAVRLFAINALERITGKADRFGYDPYASEHDRRTAIDQWVTWAETKYGDQ